MSTSKIRIKMGPIEVECEGSEQFLTKELPDILTAVSRLYDERKNGGDEVDREEHGDGKKGANGKIVGTTATIAGKLGAKSGTDLAIAAAAHLTIVASRHEFSRKDLLEQMQGASGYYKDSYGSNFSNYLRTLVRNGDLVEPRSDVYALNATKATALRSTLAAT
jgi:hypothetical protein